MKFDTFCYKVWESLDYKYIAKAHPPLFFSFLKKSSIFYFMAGNRYKKMIFSIFRVFLPFVVI